MESTEDATSDLVLMEYRAACDVSAATFMIEAESAYMEYLSVCSSASDDMSVCVAPESRRYESLMGDRNAAYYDAVVAADALVSARANATARFESVTASAWSVCDARIRAAGDVYTRALREARSKYFSEVTGENA